MPKSDENVKQMILKKLEDGAVISEFGSPHELHRKIAPEVSFGCFKASLGRLVRNNQVHWHRPPAQHRDDDDRPITIKLPEQMAVPSR